MGAGVDVCGGFEVAHCLMSVRVSKVCGSGEGCERTLTSFGELQLRSLVVWWMKVERVYEMPL